MAGIYLELAIGSFTAQSVNKSVPSGGSWGKGNDFSFVGGAGNRPRTACQMLGDINIRVAPVNDAASDKGASGTPWAIYDSAFGSEASWQDIKPVSGGGPNVLAAHDITAVLASSTAYSGYNNSLFSATPLQVLYFLREG